VRAKERASGLAVAATTLLYSLAADTAATTADKLIHRKRLMIDRNTVIELSAGEDRFFATAVCKAWYAR
jgi:hypothetical protein